MTRPLPVTFLTLPKTLRDDKLVFNFLPIHPISSIFAQKMLSLKYTAVK